MVNLLSRRTAIPPFPRFDSEQLARFEARLATLSALSASPLLQRDLEPRFHALAPELEELENGSSLITALDLLDGVERIRRAALDRISQPKDHAEPSSMGRPGDLVCHWPGRSLATGEAEIASRGFFDGLDRPPLRYWLEVISRPTPTTRSSFEVAILAWIPAEDEVRARAGCRVCTSGALAFLGDVSPELARQLDPILGVEARR